jgi:hypothetical protein
MFKGPHKQAGCAGLAKIWVAIWAAILFFPLGVPAARAFDFSVHGYGDLRLVAPPPQTSWLDGGLSKFRYGGNTHLRFAEAVAQGDLSFDDFDAVAVLRAEPEQRSGIDALEAYLSWHPQADGDFSWSVKTGAFFPAISLENGDLGWTSPYTLTPSAINSWIGNELRTIGSEATLRWHTANAGTISVIGAVTCCNDPAGILMADRGWSMDDRPSGLFERVLMPDATERLFHVTPPARTGLFDEIDNRPGWYLGLDWQIAGIGKLSVLRYDNDGDPAAHTVNDTAWDTRFYSAGFRTQIDSLVLIAQALRGQTVVVPRPGSISDTQFQSAFLLASYDLDDWRFSMREDVFQTRHLGSTPSVMSEDGHAFTAAVSWSGYDWLRITGEVLVMDSRRGEYLSDGFPSAQVGQTQTQLSARFFF